MELFFAVELANLSERITKLSKERNVTEIFIMRELVQVFAITSTNGDEKAYLDFIEEFTEDAKNQYSNCKQAFDFSEKENKKLKEKFPKDQESFDLGVEAWKSFLESWHETIQEMKKNKD